MSEKKLMRSTRDCKLFGVCGGLAEYFGVDSTVVRLIAVILVIFAGMSFWLYIIAALIMPVDDGTYDVDYKEHDNDSY
ncbi:MAG: PspC domain-containing protein [Acetatifactor sp.]|nr:PspC domain-containing protein [Acetatifactor sp.]